MKILFVNLILRTAETDDIPRVDSIKDCLGFTMCKSLQDLGHDVTLFAAEDYRPSREEEYPFPVIFAKTWLRKLFKPRAIPFTPSLATHLLRHGKEYDLVVGSEVFALHSLIAAIVCPAKLVVWHELSQHPRMMKTLASRCWYNLFKPVFSRAKAICPRSTRAREFLYRYFGNVVQEPIGHGVDLEKFPVASVVEDRFVVCSQLIERKRVDETVSKFAGYLSKYPDAPEELVVIGNGDRMLALQEQVRQLGIESRVRFTGRLTHAQMVPLLSGAKALLVSSRRDYALLSISESLACGTPVVTTDNVDASDLIREHGLGVASPDWTEDDLRSISLDRKGYRRNCAESRYMFSNAHLADRLVGLVDWVQGRRPGRPRVAWISQNCFVQCDMPMIPALREDFEIRWRVFYPRDDNVGFAPEALRRAASEWGMDARVEILRHRLRSPRAIFQLFALVGDLRRWKPDVVYVDGVGHPWLGPIARVLFGKRKVLWAMHDVREHGDDSRYKVYSLYKRGLLAMFDNFHLLSRNQERALHEWVPGRRSYYAPHPPTELGPRDGSPSGDKICFLFFGYVAPHKGVDVLIEAAQRAWERGVRGFEVVIAGKCENWPELQARIRIPELFRTDIRMVPNELVPGLYSRAHWLVLPYRHLTQSGPMSLAYHYNLPAVVSDLSAFAEFVDSGRTGLVFRLDDPDSLADRIVEAVAMGHEGNAAMRARLAEFVEANYSMDACRRLYRDMLVGVAGGGE